MPVRSQLLKLLSYLLIAVLIYLVLYLINRSEYKAWSWTVTLEILERLGVITLGVIMVSEIELVITRQLDKHIPWKSSIKKRIIVQLGVQVVLIYMAITLLKLTLPVFFIESLVFKQAVVISVIVSVLLTAIFTAESFLVQWKKSVLEASRYEQQVAKAQLELLKMQIDPHFLFNNFSTLTFLIEENPQLAVEYVEKLAAIYRHALKEQEGHVVLLEEELEFIHSYLFLYKLRYQDGLNVQIAIPDFLLGTGIATATLQLLIENAIKHNAISKQQPLVIDIFSEGSYLVVKNNLNHTIKKIESTGLGLKNVSERYKLLGNREIFFNKTDDSFIVKIPLLADWI